MFDGKTKDITVKELEEKVYHNDDGSKVTLVKFKDQDGLKFKFYSTRKDGQPTAAYGMFEQGHIKNGTELEVAFKELPKEKVIDGRNVKWVDRFVSFFNLKEMVQIPSTRVQEVAEIDISDLPF